MYSPIKKSTSEFVPLRDQNYHVRVWGDPKHAYKDKPLVLLHGWMDVGASFQFLVDALRLERLIIAPDWRGFGLTQAHSTQDHYVFADYLADLDFLLDHYFADESIDLLGHSMGGNVCMLYAGIRPQRIHKLINLEGFGMASTRASQAPNRYGKWLEELKKLHKGEISLQHYEDSDAVAKRLIKTNPKISMDKAQWLATHWARVGEDGKWRILGSSAHMVTSANLYREDETREIHKRIVAPVLCVTAEEDSLKKWWGDQYTLEEFYERMKVVNNITFQKLAQTGHMLHHDQPEALAKVIETFLTSQVR